MNPQDIMRKLLEEIETRDEAERLSNALLEKHGAKELNARRAELKSRYGEMFNLLHKQVNSIVGSVEEALIPALEVITPRLPESVALYLYDSLRMQMNVRIEALGNELTKALDVLRKEATEEAKGAVKN